jgi:hypothetical protein
MTESAVVALQRWYVEQCDGEWEHEYGVVIETLDNPGWQVRIDLAGTGLSGRTLDRTEEARSETDWLVYWVADDRFHAAGGPSNLEQALGRFLAWVTAA